MYDMNNDDKVWCDLLTSYKCKCKYNVCLRGLIWSELTSYKCNKEEQRQWLAARIKLCVQQLENWVSSKRWTKEVAEKMSFETQETEGDGDS